MTSFKFARWLRDHPSAKTYKAMDLPIVSRQSIRERVARNMILFPGDMDRAIAKTAEQINFTEDSVRDVLDFVEEQQS